MGKRPSSLGSKRAKSVELGPPTKITGFWGPSSSTGQQEFLCVWRKKHTRNQQKERQQFFRPQKKTWCFTTSWSLQPLIYTPKFNSLPAPEKRWDWKMIRLPFGFRELFRGDFGKTSGGYCSYQKNLVWTFFQIFITLTSFFFIFYQKFLSFPTLVFQANTSWGERCLCGVCFLGSSHTYKNKVSVWKPWETHHLHVEDFGVFLLVAKGCENPPPPSTTETIDGEVSQRADSEKRRDWGGAKRSFKWPNGSSPSLLGWLLIFHPFQGSQKLTIPKGHKCRITWGVSFFFPWLHTAHTCQKNGLIIVVILQGDWFQECWWQQRWEGHIFSPSLKKGTEKRVIDFRIHFFLQIPAFLLKQTGEKPFNLKDIWYGFKQKLGDCSKFFWLKCRAKWAKRNISGGQKVWFFVIRVVFFWINPKLIDLWIICDLSMQLVT